MADGPKAVSPVPAAGGSPGATETNQGTNHMDKNHKDGHAVMPPALFVSRCLNCGLRKILLSRSLCTVVLGLNCPQEKGIGSQFAIINSHLVIGQ